MNDRQRMITELLDEHEVSTQLQLQRLLARRGHDVTQATVSRDLDRLGVVRVRRHGRLVYALSEDSDATPADPVGQVVLALGLVRSMEASGNLLVLKTGPANAHPVAFAFDNASFPEIIGTIAGDDTPGADRPRAAQRARPDPPDRAAARGDTVNDTIVLAYSGGLDTSVALRWLADEYDADVIALLVDVGQGIDAEAVTARALAAGAADVVIVDARDEFAAEYVLPVLQAGALYEGRYPLVSALSRPLIAKHLVAVARGHGATAVAHGCTGKGNDQVRFETAVAALAPDLAVLAPVRDWGMTREQEIAYADQHGIEVPVKSGEAYSIDHNLWGRSIEAGPLEDPWQAPPESAFALTIAPERALPAPQVVEIEFEQGVPVAIDGEPLDLVLADRARRRRWPARTASVAST